MYKLVGKHQNHLLGTLNSENLIEEVFGIKLTYEKKTPNSKNDENSITFNVL